MDQSSRPNGFNVTPSPLVARAPPFSLDSSSWLTSIACDCLCCVSLPSVHFSTFFVSPYRSVCQVLAMLRFVMKPCAIRMSSIVLRGAQLALSAIALSKTAAYHSATHEANFILIATYSSMMYALWHLVCVEFLKIANRPRKLLSRIIDLGMAVLLVAAAISVKVAGYFPKCEPYRTNMIKCTDMSNIVVYTWVIVMPLICTFVLTYVVSSKDMELSMQPTEYVLETTPKAMKDMPMTPSEKVELADQRYYHHHASSELRSLSLHKHNTRKSTVSQGVC